MDKPVVIELVRYPDERGWFAEAYNRARLAEMDILDDWIQDNHSYSKAGVIRGIHYQLDNQAKLVRCVRGRIIDVIVDLRPIPSFRHFEVYDLSAENGRTLYVPAGFGHSFIALDDSEVLYKVDKPWNKEAERGIRYDDEELAIPWECFSDEPMDFIVSEKDMALPALKDADCKFHRS